MGRPGMKPTTGKKGAGLKNRGARKALRGVGGRGGPAQGGVEYLEHVV